VFAIDPHVHTCLSPCAVLDMHPSALVEAAVRAGVDVVGICDHNSVENVPATDRAGRAAGVAILAGMEITTAEEAHILGLLPDMEAAWELQAQVYRALPGVNDERVFGPQVIANEYAEVLGFNEHLLSGATTLSVEKTVAAIHRVGGLAVASHVDRERNGIIGQLGMIPRGLPLDALEISSRLPLPKGRADFAPRGEYPLICSSDAHEPKDLGRALTFCHMAEPTLAELRRAFAGLEGRSILGGGRPMEDLSLHILDLAQNSIEAGATGIEIDLVEQPAEDRLVIEVRDNGRGMDAAVLEQAADPFYTTRTTRRVGMGLSLIGQAARATGGRIEITSRPGSGSRVRAVFGYRHIDRAPVGDIQTTILVLLAGQPDLDIRFRHRVGERVFELDAGALRASGIDPAAPEGLTALRRILREGEESLGKSRSQEPEATSRK
jgi:hypothetical protein